MLLCGFVSPIELFINSFRDDFDDVFVHSVGNSFIAFLIDSFVDSFAASFDVSFMADAFAISNRCLSQTLFRG